MGAANHRVAQGTRAIKAFPMLAELEKPRSAAPAALVALNLVTAESAASAHRAVVVPLPMHADAAAAAIRTAALHSPVNADPAADANRALVLLPAVLAQVASAGASQPTL